MSAFRGTRAQAVSDLRPRFGPADYNICTNNCNHLSDALCRRLLGKPIPGEWCGEWRGDSCIADAVSHKAPTPPPPLLMGAQATSTGWRTWAAASLGACPSPCSQGSPVRSLSLHLLCLLSQPRMAYLAPFRPPPPIVYRHSPGVGGAWVVGLRGHRRRRATPGEQARGARGARAATLLRCPHGAPSFSAFLSSRSSRDTLNIG